MSPRLNGRAAVTERGAVPAYFLYGEPQRAPDARTVHVETIGARSSLHDWKIRAHRHRDLHQVLIVMRGPVESQLDGVRSAQRGPAVVIVPPLTVHSFQFDHETDGVVVTFAAPLAHEIFHDARALRECLDRPAAHTVPRAQFAATDIELLSSVLLREFARGATGRDHALHGLLTTLLTNVLRLSEEAVGPQRAADNREREVVAHFRELVERRYRDHPDLGSYAREIGISQAALRKSCIRVAGQSPIQLVQERMLIEAERQLRYSGMSITQIAYYLGFEDPAYFSRFFAKGRGASPRSFRRSTGTT